MSAQRNSVNKPLVCYLCKGNRFSRQGMPCEPCGGSGYLSDAFTSQVQGWIKESMDMSLPNAMARMNQSQIGLSQSRVSEADLAASVRIDKQAKQRRYEEEARMILSSRPLTKPQEAHPAKAILDCEFVSENFTDNYVVQRGQRVTKRWVFKNTGAQYIPQDSCLM